MSRVPVMVATVQRMLGNRTRSITVNVTEPPSQLQQVPGTDPPSPVISDQPTTRVDIATDDIDTPVRPDDYIVPDNPDTRPGLNACPYLSFSSSSRATSSRYSSCRILC